jgi:hypothetical protein
MQRWSHWVALGAIFCFLTFLIQLAHAAPNGTTTRGRTCANRLSGCLSKCDNTNAACRDVCSGGWDDCIDHGGWSTKQQAVRSDPYKRPIVNPYKHRIGNDGDRYGESEGLHRRLGSDGDRYGESEGFHRHPGSDGARFRGSDGFQTKQPVFPDGASHNGGGGFGGGGSHMRRH